MQTVSCHCSPIFRKLNLRTQRFTRRYMKTMNDIVITTVVPVPIKY